MSNPIANISIAASLEKAKLSSGSPWYALVVITWPDGSALRLVRNTDDIQFDCGDGHGVQTYTAFNWKFDTLEQKSDGSIPTWGVKCSNVNRSVEALLEQFGGGVGGNVAIYVVNGSSLKREAELELYFSIVESGSDVHWVTFTLGAPSPFRILYIRHTFAPDRCIWQYKSTQCGYTGSLPTCSLSLVDSNGCRVHANAANFGGFPGIDSNGIRAVNVK